MVTCFVFSVCHRSPAQRRNKWICALKRALAEAKIFGPSGDPNAKPDPTRYTQVPWEDVQVEERKTAKQPIPFDPAHTQNWSLFDKNAVICTVTR
jgi:hypothetical protein